MNLQPALQNKAVKSPCRRCLTLATADYPDCNETCKKVNDYLRHLGDKPHIQLKNENLDKQFPPQQGSGYRSYSFKDSDLVSQEDTKIAENRVRELRQTMKPKEISDMLGISSSYVNALVRGGNIKRMSKEKYAAIMGEK
jgi:hypothetical protein